jgi:tripartite-type tricarboxylate transporter receptor subunit TctC
MMAPAGISPPISELLEREVRQVLAAPELQEKFRAHDIEIVATTSADAKARIKADAKLWAKVVNAADMRVD